MLMVNSDTGEEETGRGLGLVLKDAYGYAADIGNRTRHL